MPPEALVYSKYSLQSDIFSLGVLFYEILCGHTPWESRSEKELITKMAKTPLVFPNSLSESLKEMLEGCLAINIAQRFTVDKLYNCEYVRSLFGNPE
jgi:serine/threonine protein kinase